MFLMFLLVFVFVYIASLVFFGWLVGWLGWLVVWISLLVAWVGFGLVLFWFIIRKAFNMF